VTKSSIESAALRLFNAAQAGDQFTFRQNSISLVQQNFSQLEPVLVAGKEALAGGHAIVRNHFLLNAENATSQEYLCGVFGTSEFVAFTPSSLPPGRYAIVILDITGGQVPMLAMMLQQDGNSWKVANYFAHNPVAGHDGRWFWEHAREFKFKGQDRNAWLYYQTALNLVPPVPFMHTKALDHFHDEATQAQVSDVAQNGQTISIPGVGKTYTITDLFFVPVKQDLDLVVKYKSLDISSPEATTAENQAVMGSFLKQYPEYREAFAALVVRAVDPKGQEYGTLAAMSDIK
jgi:hypothetical protein